MHPSVVRVPDLGVPPAAYRIRVKLRKHMLRQRYTSSTYARTVVTQQPTKPLLKLVLIVVPDEQR